MDWLSFTFGFLANFAVLGIGVFVAALVIAVRNAGKKK